MNADLIALLVGSGDLHIRLTGPELRAIYEALEFEGYGSSRDDLRELLRERIREALEA